MLAPTNSSRGDQERWDIPDGSDPSEQGDEQQCQERCPSPGPAVAVLGKDNPAGGREPGLSTTGLTQPCARAVLCARLL